jgi:hypothetical protein
MHCHFAPASVSRSSPWTNHFPTLPHIGVTTPKPPAFHVDRSAQEAAKTVSDARNRAMQALTLNKAQRGAQPLTLYCLREATAGPPIQPEPQNEVDACATEPHLLDGFLAGQHNHPSVLMSNSVPAANQLVINHVRGLKTVRQPN